MANPERMRKLAMRLYALSVKTKDPEFVELLIARAAEYFDRANALDAAQPALPPSRRRERADLFASRWVFPTVPNAADVFVATEMWMLVQLAIVLLIVWSNFVYSWTQTGYLPILIGWFMARVITGVGWRLWHWRHGLPVPATEPFHKNLIAHKTIAVEATDNIQVAPQYSVQSVKPVDPEEARHWVERLERQLKRRQTRSAHMAT
jgi:hypothetical protein